MGVIGTVSNQLDLSVVHPSYAHECIDIVAGLSPEDERIVLQLEDDRMRYLEWESDLQVARRARRLAQLGVQLPGVPVVDPTKTFEEPEPPFSEEEFRLKEFEILARYAGEETTVEFRDPPTPDQPEGRTYRIHPRNPEFWAKLPPNIRDVVRPFYNRHLRSITDRLAREDFTKSSGSSSGARNGRAS